MDAAQTPLLQFPTAQDVPDTFRLSQPLHQQVYLVNGELRTWEGPRQEVVSPVWTRTNEQLTPTVLGSYPLLTSQEARSALQAAVTAYDQGRGAWPLMSVAQRISHPGLCRAHAGG
jgi:glyceraldehyde-3-phosphate dehydrogenase (NADP+)